MTCRQISLNRFLLWNYAMKKVSQAHSNWFVFKEHRLKKQVAQIWIGLSELDNSYARWCCGNFFDLCFIIDQSDTRNRVYLISWLQKLVWNTFVNCEGPYWGVCPCFDIVLAQLGIIPRTRNNFVGINNAFFQFSLSFAWLFHELCFNCCLGVV